MAATALPVRAQGAATYVIAPDSRFEVATADDSPAAQQDGVLSFMAPEEGTYYVQVRETSYAGDGNCRYRLHVGTFPRPTAVYPAGGKAGETVAVTFLGDAAGPIQQEIAVPASVEPAAGGIVPVFARDGQGVCPTALPFRVTSLGNALEAGETLHEAVVRETLEETAYAFAPEALVGTSYQNTAWQTSSALTVTDAQNIACEARNTDATPVANAIVLKEFQIRYVPYR